MTLVVGVDIGGTKTSAGLVDSSGTLLAVRTLPTPAAQGPAAVLDTAAGLVGEVASGAGEVTAVGVGSAGVVDPRRGVIVSATDAITGWAGTDLRGEVSRRLGLPVAVDNDVHAHALGEQWRGAAAGYADVLLVAVGTGIGASVVLGGRVLRGAHSVAGHAGHVPAVAAAGRPCPCGGYGHVEAVASGPAMLAEYRGRAAAAATEPSGAPEPAGVPGSAGAPEPAGVPGSAGVPGLAGAPGSSGVTGPAAVSEPAAVSGSARVTGLADVARLAAEGDRIAVSVLTGGAAALGSTIGGLMNVIDPEVVVVGGGVAACGELWWQALREGIAAEVLPALREVPVGPAALGGDAALLGAARMALEVAG
ncbi:ROK family protein [Streptosporangium roseum]|uniref:Transcriptional regulator protein n=1 Tax=Streptosporangium roseum (strain ATCC 12428 / DSM 43021 / JCM 3005 / KCTC 9067 / NCIMB 10171 / NRRL 2505 / NI 9100) TaxID=479432 RepID=D2B2X2_STRRD|nr:ROK family protein [Streptosporangium roseum]ACZ85452.1 transcriptional regulator protein [Streptosporangium roseum DSM 43021]